MFGSTIIDVAIGLIFIYFLLSMISSKINDLIAHWMQWRAKDLENGIRTLLGDPLIADKVWNHSLVQGLAGKSNKAPSHIPANTFALALFDTLVPGGNDPTALQQVRAQVVTMSDNPVKQAVLPFIDAANGDITKARLGVENWFNSAMDQVSSAYARRIQYLTIFVALGVTIIFGADTISFANSLWREPGLRAAVSGAAQATQTNSLNNAVTTLSQFDLPIGWQIMPVTPIDWLQKIIGLLLTTLAVSLGAPFWYDLLKNLSSLRNPSAASTTVTSGAPVTVTTSPTTTTPVTTTTTTTSPVITTPVNPAPAAPTVPVIPAPVTTHPASEEPLPPPPTPASQI